MFDEEYKKVDEWFLTALATTVGEAFRVDPSGGEEIGPVETDDMKVQVASGKVDVVNGHTIAISHCRGIDDVGGFARLALKRGTV